MSVNMFVLLVGSGEPCERQRKVKICAVVQVLFGEKVVLDVPAVIPLSTAQATEFA